MHPKSAQKRGRGRPREPEKRTAIIAAVRELFGQHGYNGVSLDKLASAAGMHKAGLLHHYSSKEKLYCALMVSLVEELLKQLRSVMLGRGTFRERVSLLADVMTRYFITSPNVAKLLLREGIGDGPFFKSTEQPLVAPIGDAMAVFIRWGIEEGDFAGQEPKTAVLAIASYLLVLYGAPNISRDVLPIDVVDEESIVRESQRFEAFMVQLLGAA